MIAQASVVLEGALNLPDWFDTIIVVALLLGFPIALILAWAFELTPDGFKPTGKADTPPDTQTSKKRGLNIALGTGLAAAIAFIAFDTIVLDRRAPEIIETAEARDASIAVLPFADMSAAQDQVYFGDGIAEELLNLLAKVDGLRVASRTSAFTFRERTSSIDEIAEALNVAHVLEGSIRKSGNQVRITAQLIETGNDEHLWSETYDRALTAENLFAIQDEIAQAIIEEVGGQLQFSTRAELPTTSTAAYELFLSGRAKVERRGSDDILDGIKDLEAAMRIDPDFFDAALYLTNAHKLAALYSDINFDESLKRADDWMVRAKIMRPNDPRLILAEAFLQYNRSEFDQTALISDFETALRLNPNSAEAYRGLALILNGNGRTEEALSTIQKALELDPISSINIANAGNYAFLIGRFDEATEYYAQLLKLEPGSTFALSNLALFSDYQGDARTAHRILMSRRDEYRLTRLRGWLYMRLGLFDEASKIDADRVRAYQAMIAGDIETMKALLPIIDEDEYLLSGEFIDYAGLQDEAKAVFDRLRGGVLDGLLSDQPLSFNLEGGLALIYTHVHAESDPDRVALVRGKIDEAFREASRNGQALPYVYSHLARWHARRKRPDDMMGALNALFDLGYADGFEQYFHDYDAYRDDSRFQDWVARMDARVAEQRAEIEADLANPPDPWWTPEMLEKTPSLLKP